MRYILITLFRGYRLVVSPLYAQTCRYYPSCSAYALQAVEDHGAAKGSWLAIWRLLRCHPWAPGGVDPVPPQVGWREGMCSAETREARRPVRAERQRLR